VSLALHVRYPLVEFRLTERFSLQARGDLFNILNHPNFGSPINNLSSPQFGQSTIMLASYLGSGGQSGGLNPLYKIGGPRSIQLALNLVSSWPLLFALNRCPILDVERCCICGSLISKSSPIADPN